MARECRAPARQRATDADKPLSDSPHWVGKAHVISPPLGGWQLGTELTAVSSRDGAGHVPGYVEWNANIAWRYNANDRLALRVLNAGDAHSAEPVSLDNLLTQVPRPRRTLWLDWRVAF